jgi:hypothetical protein
MQFRLGLRGVRQPGQLQLQLDAGRVQDDLRLEVEEQPSLRVGVGAVESATGAEHLDLVKHVGTGLFCGGVGGPLGGEGVQLGGEAGRLVAQGLVPADERRLVDRAGLDQVEQARLLPLDLREALAQVLRGVGARGGACLDQDRRVGEHGGELRPDGAFD